MDEQDLGERLKVAIVSAREAGDITLEYFCRDNYEIDLKQDTTPVTIADRRAEQHLRARISESFPDDGIVGEELPDQPGTSVFRWILDPIDGTKSFISGVPLYGTLVGVEYAGKSVIGVIHMPALAETVHAATGHGAWHSIAGHEPEPTRVSSTEKLSDGLFCLCEYQSFLDTNRKEAYQQLQSAARLTRTWGDCYGYLLVATGRAVLMADPVMNVWDAAAVQPVLEEAGGTFTDWQGNPTIHSREGIGTNGHVLEEVLTITRGK